MTTSEPSVVGGAGRRLLRSTSWGGRGRSPLARSGAALARVTAVVAAASGLLPAALALPASADTAVVTQPVVVVGSGASASAQSVGAADVERLAPNVATANADDADVAALRTAGYKVVPDVPVTLAEGGPAEPAAARARIAVRDSLGAGRLGDGAGVAIAVVDSGVDPVPGLAGRVVQGVDLTGTGFGDAYGHGTFVAGLAAGDGTGADGGQTGIVGAAPRATVVSVKVADANGRSTVGRVMAGLTWVLDHRAQYGIRVVNLSLSTGAASTYSSDPLDALVEAAWFSGLTVVTSAGNSGGPVTSSPGNDPFVLTVGSTYDANTAQPDDDTVSAYSNAGTLSNGTAKPELTVTGEHVQAPLPAGSALASAQTTPGLPAGYGQLSGTSMSAGVASGAAALLLAQRPALTPDQVKALLVGTRYQPLTELQVAAASASDPGPNVNAGLRPSGMLGGLLVLMRQLPFPYFRSLGATNEDGSSVWSNVTWSNVTWSNVAWSNVAWSNVTWSNVVWSNVVWSNVTWSNVTWSNVVWSNAAALGA